jgi:hypothetical protein
MDNLTTIDIANALVAQTDAEDGDTTGEVADNVVRDTCLERGAGSRGDDNVGWTQTLDLFQGYLVIAVDQRLPSQFTQVLGEVINK